MTQTAITVATSNIESLLVRNNHRGMERVRRHLQAGYLARAAELIRHSAGNAYIVTGFPVAGTFETDGPAGAMALYRLCERNNLAPTILAEPALTRALCDRFRCVDLATGSPDQIIDEVTALYRSAPPGLFISIERPGAAADGRYYNMAGQDISDHCAWAEPYLELASCPTIAIGDGGNELGMGSAIEAISTLAVKPAASTCDELVVADVSNWAAYALCVLTDVMSGDITDIGADIRGDLSYLVQQGAVDGVTGLPTATEDGFAENAGNALLEEIIPMALRANKS
ncbi:MAG: DUF4392 domain-containing protein [Luminiphilus sp.]|nr:DUF4392 domain-containing protein [Luminiphilus sp.]